MPTYDNKISSVTNITLSRHNNIELSITAKVVDWTLTELTTMYRYMQQDDQTSLKVAMEKLISDLDSYLVEAQASNNRRVNEFEAAGSIPRTP